MIEKGKEIKNERVREREKHRREENTEKTDKEKNENSGVRARGENFELLEFP